MKPLTCKQVEQKCRRAIERRQRGAGMVIIADPKENVRTFADGDMMLLVSAMRTLRKKNEKFNQVIIMAAMPEPDYKKAISGSQADKSETTTNE